MFSMLLCNLDIQTASDILYEGVLITLKAIPQLISNDPEFISPEFSSPSSSNTIDLDDKSKNDEHNCCQISSLAIQQSSVMAKKNKNNKVNTPQKYFTNCKSFYSCIHCRAHLANHDDIVSRSFQGNFSRAYLFTSLINVSLGPSVQRELLTGAHAVADLFCSICKTMIGWKYERAFVETQKYKEGKFIIEISHVIRENKHLEMDRGERFLKREVGRVLDDNNSTCVFNSTSNQQNIYSTSEPSVSDSPLTNRITDESFKHSSRTSASALNTPYNANKHSLDDYDDLNSPIFDDLYSKLLVYPSSLSQSHCRRIKRELFFNSKPYDWKSTRSLRISQTHDSDLQLQYPNSAGSSAPLSPVSSCSSSPASTSSSMLQNNISLDKCNQNSALTKFGVESLSLLQKSDLDETQFNLEGVDCSSSLQGKSLDFDPSNNAARSTLSLDDEEYFDCSSDIVS